MEDAAAVKVNANQGEMPPVWQKQVIFFANILALFFGNDSETDVLRKEVGTLETYGSRLVPILNLMFEGPSNVLILERKPVGTLLEYFQRDLGLSLPEIKVLAHEDYRSFLNEPSGYSQQAQSILEALSEHPGKWIDGYVTDRVLVHIAELSHKLTVSSMEGSRRGNNKLLLHEHMLSKKFSVFDTLTAKTSKDLQKAFEKLKKKGYTKAVIKAQIGASGIGMKKVDLQEGLDSVPDYIFYEGPCLVQGWLDESIKNVQYIGSPSVQLLLNDECVSMYDLTEQFLSNDSVHEGNIAPPRFLKGEEKITGEIFHQTKVAGTWLHAKGYRGSASCDFHVIKRSGKSEVRLCEINARVTGATYPSLLSRHFLPKGAWLMRNIRFSPPTRDVFLLETLKEKKLLFQIGRQEGVIPFNFNFDQRGAILKGQFLFLGKTSERANELLEYLIHVESLNGDYDRD